MAACEAVFLGVVWADSCVWVAKAFGYHLTMGAGDFDECRIRGRLGLKTSTGVIDERIVAVSRCL